jgi:hypothetical protein
MTFVSSILGFFKILIFRRDILKILKKKSILNLASKKDEHTIVSNFGIEKKKVDKYPLFSTENVAKEFNNS